VRDAGQHRHTWERQVGLGQQLSHPPQLNLTDFGVRRAADRLAEAPLQERARNGHVPEHVPHSDPVTGVLSNEPDGRRYLVVLDRQRVRGLAGDDRDRRTNMHPASASLPAISAASSSAAR